DLGGSEAHTHKSGVADKRFTTEMEMLQKTRKLLGYLPSNNLEKAPRLNRDNTPSPSKSETLLDSLDTIMPEQANQPYNMQTVINVIIDEESFFELKDEFAPHIITGLGRLNGDSIGIIANNPMHLAGVLDIDASVKAARFVRFCDAFNIPLVTF